MDVDEVAGEQKTSARRGSIFGLFLDKESRQQSLKRSETPSPAISPKTVRICIVGDSFSGKTTLVK
jgi:GTPase SAR1 family protein